MSIDKPEAGSSFLNKVGFGFTVLDNEAIKKIGDAVAIGVWAYLCSKPQSWRVNEKEVCASLNLGRDRYRRAMKRLHDIGLVWHEYTRDKGKIVCKQVSVTWTIAHANTNHDNHKPEKPTYDKTMRPDNHEPEKPTDGENHLKVSQAVLVKKDRSLEKKERSLESGVKKKFTPPTQQEVEDYMLTKGANFDEAADWAENYMLHYQGNGWMQGKNKLKCWKSSVTRWTKGDIGKRGNGSETHQQTRRRTIADTLNNDF